MKWTITRDPLLLIAAFGLVSCGGQAAKNAPSSLPSQPPESAQNAVITSIGPSSVVAGGASFQLTITGQYFYQVRRFADEGDYVVYFGGTRLTTTVVSDTELTAIVPATSIAVPGNVSVSAVTPDFYTNAVSFSILVPTQASLFPSSASLATNATIQFAASFSSPVWSVQEGSTGGSITDAGLYTAPTHPGTFHVVATSEANQSDSAAATVIVAKSGFSQAGNMHNARSGHSATLLRDGRVLIVGADGTAELFDPSTGQFSVTGSLIEPRSGATFTLLSNGKVLVAGGFGLGSSGPLPRLYTAELYDALSGNFTNTGSMSHGRVSHTATLLNDGRVLITGGTDTNIGGGSATSSAELYDPSTGTFTSTGDMHTDRAQHTATLLTTGEVLIVGGWNGHSADAPDDPPWDPLFAELFNPSTGTFQEVSNMSTTRIGHTSTLLANGNVLVLGGIPALQNLHEQPPDPQFAEVYDPITQKFTSLGNLTVARTGYTVTLLNSGELLLAGGKFLEVAVSTAELLDPTTGLLNVTGQLGTGRVGHTATLLTDGRVLITGGTDADGNALASSELYE